MYAIMLAISIHVLAAVFWAGSTMAVAVTGVADKRLFSHQMGAALIVCGAGAYLWGELHAAGDGPVEHMLGIGAGCAIAALLAQAIVVGPALFAKPTGDEARVRRRIIAAYRVSALLLAAAAVAMAASRYA